VHILRGDILLIAGDVFDNARISDAVLECFTSEMARASVPAVILPGNHDLFDAMSLYHRPPFANSPDNLHIISDTRGQTLTFPHLSLEIWGRAMDSHTPAFRPLAGLPSRRNELWRVAVAHGHFHFEDDRDQRSSPIYPDDVASSACHYLALGHWDRHADVSRASTTAVYSGCPYGPIGSPEQGAVCAVDLDPAAGAGTRQIIESRGGRALFVAGDIADADYVQRLVAAAVEHFGGVDVLHNNAGVIRYGTVVDLSVEDWDYQLNINLRASFLTCKYCIPEMQKRGGGAIVNTSSAQAVASQQTVAAYAAAKGAIVSFTTTVALDHARENIRCDCIGPGSIQTPMLDDAANTFGPADPASMIVDWGDKHPIGRVGRPEEVANLVLFLASDEAKYITGVILPVDGGVTVRGPDR